MSTPTSTAIYVRISKDSQGQGLGVKRQQELCEKLAADKGWQVGRVYSDNDLSAYTGKPRPGYEQMLSDLEAGTVDGVIVVDQDRLTRHPMELEGFIILADRLGIPLANVQGDTDLSTTDGRFKARIMGAVARQESERKADRVKRQKEQSASNGWWQGGARPYGYQPGVTEEGHPTLIVEPQEAILIRFMADWALAGESLRAIATYLNDLDIPTAREAKWRVSTVRATLTNATVAGLRTHQGEVVGDATWSGILDRVKWEQVKAVLDTRSKPKVGRPSNHLLTGLLKCHKCGGTLWARNHKDTARYVCVKKPNNDHCGGTSINADPLEDYITQGAIAYLTKAKPTTEIPVDADGTTEEIEELEARMKRLSELHWGEGQMTEGEYLAGRNRLEQKLRELHDQMAKTVSIPIQDHVALWHEYTLSEKRKALSQIIEQIIVLPGNRWTKVADRLDIHFHGWQDDLDSLTS